MRNGMSMAVGICGLSLSLLSRRESQSGFWTVSTRPENTSIFYYFIILEKPASIPKVYQFEGRLIDLGVALARVVSTKTTISK